MRAALCALAVFCGIAIGCATPGPQATERARRAIRAYPYAFDRVHAAVLAAASAERLSVVEVEPAAGRVVLANSLTATGQPETITVTVTRAGATSSEVHVEHLPRPPARDLPPNWGRIVDDRFGESREAPSRAAGLAIDWRSVLHRRIEAELAGTR